VSVVDAPGHERFVRTMVAGASGIDLYLLCVAADDGVMPQTREHLAVLRQLGVSDGVVAITKADIGEPELAAELCAPESHRKGGPSTYWSVASPRTFDCDRLTQVGGGSSPRPQIRT
jgi:GTPase Era involved in 16S rRNA processing